MKYLLFYLLISILHNFYMSVFFFTKFFLPKKKKKINQKKKHLEKRPRSQRFTESQIKITGNYNKTRFNQTNKQINCS